MRLFVAIVPPPAALAELAAAVGRLAAGNDQGRLRWTTSEQWHLTLSFLGEVEDTVLPALRIRLERAVGRHPAQRLAIAGGGAFPSPRKARVLWAGFRADDRGLAALAASVGAAARRAGAPPPDEGRRFTAHLTLARCRDGADLSGLAAALAGFAGQEWTAESARLIRSDLSGASPRYQDLGEWPLRLPAAPGPGR